MTKLEEEIAKSLPFAHSIEGEEFTEVPDEYLAQVAKAAAKVAKKYIERAYIEGYYACPPDDAIEWVTAELSGHAFAKRWLKENGIIE